MPQRHSFPLFQSHLDLAHTYWQKIVAPSDCVIDATCGNGHDTLALAKLLAVCGTDGGCLIAMDLQESAIAATRVLLNLHLPHLADRIQFYQQCHSSFPAWIQPASVKLIVYNLGYLPGSDKSLTTVSQTTEQSLLAALPLISAGGVISVTCYPGHPAGQLETERVRNFVATLDPRIWSCCFHQWTNRHSSPELLLLQRSL